MIEEIKKEIELYIIKNYKDRYDELVDDIWEILDKYKNQETFLNERIDTLKDTQLKQLNKISELEKYKNAWNELKDDCREVEKDNDYILFKRLEQLEKKYNIGGK